MNRKYQWLMFGLMLVGSLFEASTPILSNITDSAELYTPWQKARKHTITARRGTLQWEAQRARARGKTQATVSDPCSAAQDIPGAQLTGIPTS